MAITTYAELQTAISDNTTGWLYQNNTSARVTDFITLCEAEMNKRLSVSPIRPMQKRASVTIDAEFVAAPTDMVKPDAFEITSLSHEWRMGYIEPEDMAQRRWAMDARREELLSLLGAKPPEFFTIVGSEFRFQPTPETSFTAELSYFSRIPALSISNTSNWMLAAHPDAYLYGALAVATTFTDDDRRLATFSDLFTNAMNGVIASYPKPSSKAQLRMDDMPTVRSGWMNA